MSDKTKTILIVKPKSISKEDKAKLEETDFIIIEHDNPNDIKTIYGSLDHNIIASSAIESIDGGYSTADLQAQFARKILKKIQTPKPTP